MPNTLTLSAPGTESSPTRERNKGERKGAHGALFQKPSGKIRAFSECMQRRIHSPSIRPDRPEDLARFRLAVYPNRKCSRPEKGTRWMRISIIIRSAD
jgi:hypothetical protein